MSRKVKPSKSEYPVATNGEMTGIRVKLTKHHVYAGLTGTIVRWGDTMFGRRPVVKLDDAPGVPYGHECFLMTTKDAFPIR